MISHSSNRQCTDTIFYFYLQVSASIAARRSPAKRLSCDTRNTVALWSHQPYLLSSAHIVLAFSVGRIVCEITCWPATAAENVSQLIFVEIDFFFLCRNDCGCQINAKEKKVVDLLKAKNEWSKERNVTDEMVFWVVSWCRDYYIDSVDLHGITFEVTASPSLFWCTIGDFFSVIDFSFLLKSFCSEWN